MFSTKGAELLTVLEKYERRCLSRVTHKYERRLLSRVTHKSELTLDHRPNVEAKI